MIFKTLLFLCCPVFITQIYVPLHILSLSPLFYVLVSILLFFLSVFRLNFADLRDKTKGHNPHLHLYSSPRFQSSLFSLLLLFVHCFKAVPNLLPSWLQHCDLPLWYLYYIPLSFFSLSLCRPSPPSVYSHPLCPFLTLSFSLIPSLITPPLRRPVRPSSGLQLFQPLLLHILFQGLKPSQTISSSVFCTKGQRKWGEVCRVHMMWWNSGGLQVPFSSNANMLIEFLSHFLAFVFRFTSPLLELCLAPKGKWGIHLEWDILPIVSLSLENIWMLEKCIFV